MPLRNYSLTPPYALVAGQRSLFQPVDDTWCPKGQRSNKKKAKIHWSSVSRDPFRWKNRNRWLLLEAIYAVLSKTIIQSSKSSIQFSLRRQIPSLLITFYYKSNQIPPLGIRVELDLHAIGFQQKDAVQSSISTTPPWILDHPHVNFDLHCFHKEDTPPEIYRSRFPQNIALKLTSNFTSRPLTLTRNTIRH